MVGQWRTPSHPPLEVILPEGLRKGSASDEWRQEDVEKELQEHVRLIGRLAWQVECSVDTDSRSGDLQQEVYRLFDLMEDRLGQSSQLSLEARETIGRHVAADFLPLLMLTKVGRRFREKPLGYAGDFITIQLIYLCQPGGLGAAGPIIDRCFLNNVSALAVRRRRHCLVGTIKELVRCSRGRPLRVTSLACGPAMEILDAFKDLGVGEHLHVQLIDSDPQAVAWVRRWVEKNKLERHVRVVQANLAHVVKGKGNIKLDQCQDLIYSMGLTDYFSDPMVVSLLNYVHGSLSEQGMAMVGNFVAGNPFKAGLDYLLNWRLAHRSPEDMCRLFKASRFGRPCEVSEEGVQLFARCAKGLPSKM